MSATAARRCAVEIVTRVRERNAYAHETAASVLAGRDLSTADTALCTRAAYGAIATRGTLEEAISDHIREGMRVEPRVMDALVVSAYEILFMRTPHRASVSQGVELVREISARAAGFANAVLRKVADSAETFPWGDPSVSDSALSRLHGHPHWMAELWIEELGRQTAAEMMSADNEPAPLFGYVLPFGQGEGPSAEGIRDLGEPVIELPIEGSIQFEDSTSVSRLEAVRRREVLIMDAGAQFAAHTVPLGNDTSVAELGAGRGSKSLVLAARAKRAGLSVDVTAVDVHEFKLDALRADAARLDIGSIHTLVADASDPDADWIRASEGFDAVLVDAPCSGLGTLRRHPDRRWRARPAEMVQLAALGSRLLQTAAALVKPGGFVVYSTCTVARVENQRVIERFLASQQGAAFSIDPLGLEVPAPWNRFITTEGYFQSVPTADGPDGHFVARLVRAQS